jgi:hypothetical protein
MERQPAVIRIKPASDNTARPPLQTFSRMGGFVDGKRLVPGKVRPYQMTDHSCGAIEGSVSSEVLRIRDQDSVRTGRVRAL